MPGVIGERSKGSRFLPAGRSHYFCYSGWKGRVGDALRPNAVKRKQRVSAEMKEPSELTPGTMLRKHAKVTKVICTTEPTFDATAAFNHFSVTL